MSDWKDIISAPKYVKNAYNKRQTVFIDILAKRWDQETDTFEFQRFTKCYWSEDNGGCWEGVATSWRAVAWIEIPKIPTEWPMNELQKE